MTTALRNCSIARFFRFGLMALFAAFLVACGGGAGTVGIASGISLFTTAPSAVSIPVGGTVNYTVGGGTPIYNARSSNPSVTTASISGNGTILTVKGLISGVSQVSISDAVGASVTISVTVDTGGTTTALFTTAPSAVTINPGSVGTYNVGGGTGPYTASSSKPSVATAGISSSGTSLSIIASTVGTAQISVFDSTGASVIIAVTVGSGTATALFTSAPSAVTLAVGLTASFTIGGGTPAYAVSSSNSAVAKVAINGSTFIISGIAAGTAQVAVLDSTGTSVTINVTVGSGGTTTALYTTAASAVTIGVGAVTTYDIGGGTAPYRATSSNTTVAAAGVSGTSLSINGVGAGAAQVLVFDATGASVTIAVTVGSGGATTTLFTTAPSAITIAIGGTESYVISGGTAPYAASSSNSSVTTAGVTGTALSINGVSAGAAEVVVFDAVGASVTIAVTVGAGGTTTALYTTAASTVTIAMGVTETYAVGGGTAPYVVASSNTGVATVAISGTALTITGVAGGAAQISVFDTTGVSVKIDVTVPQVATTPVSVLPDGATGNVGDVVTFLVSGGSAPYTVTSNNLTIATVSAVVGGSFSATLLNAGSTTVTIVDSLGQTKVFTLTVGQLSTLLRLSPSALLIGEDSTVSISLNIYGGTGPYSAYTSDLKLSSVPAGLIAAGSPSTPLTVGLGSDGGRCINPVDSSLTHIPGGTYDVTITVVDSLGASATSVMTIKDNGAIPGTASGAPPPCL